MTTPVGTAFAAMLISQLALAQPVLPPAAGPGLPAPAPGAAQPTPGPDDKKTIPIEKLPPAIRLGLRVQLTASKLPVCKTVVVVPDARSYVAALSQWRIDNRFPVLIDDGTFLARENIARFVRGYEAAGVVRWTAPAEFVWPTEPEKHAERFAIMQSAVVRAWGGDPAAEGGPAKGLVDAWKKVSFVPPGIVAINPADPAWTAGVALAAGRGEWLVVVDTPTDPTGTMTIPQALKLANEIDAAAAATGLEYRGLGDAMDAVTLCCNAPGRTIPTAADMPPSTPPFECKAGESLATTDLIGRAFGDKTFKAERWAYAGQIMGDAKSAAYAAMCSIFIQPAGALLFDGYDDKAPWNAYGMAATAEKLVDSNLQVRLFTAPSQSLNDWRTYTAGALAPRPNKPGRTKAQELAEEKMAPKSGGVEQGIICVNSSGNPDWFDLRPGRALVGDVPFLNVPTMVNFVHSWSAVSPSNISTIAGRFIQHGAFAYVGSVHEPFLQAFVPTPVFAYRLRLPMPLGPAARIDNAAPWRIAVVGDPLYVLGQMPPVNPSGPPDAIKSTMVDVATEMAAALKDRKFTTALADLALLGRDADATRLCRALLADAGAPDKPKLDADAATAAAMSAFRVADAATFVGLYRLGQQGGKIDPDKADAAPLVDALWHALWPLRDTWSAAQIDLLKTNLRTVLPNQLVRDTQEVARAIAQKNGKEAGQKFIQSVRDAATDAQAQKLLDEIIKNSTK